MLALKDYCISQGERLPSQEFNFLARLNTGPSCFPTISLIGGRGPRGAVRVGAGMVWQASPHLIFYKGRVEDQNHPGKQPTVAAFDKKLWEALQSQSPATALPSGLLPSHCLALSTASSEF